MSTNGDAMSLAGFDEADHQPAYVYTPAEAIEDAPVRPSKRRRTSKRPSSIPNCEHSSRLPAFKQLFNGLERPDCVSLRQELYQKSWAKTEAGIQSILDEANEDTLVEVTEFVNGTQKERSTTKVPTGFVVTGPNIASQELLFKQLCIKLRGETDGPVVLLRSGNTSNLKAVLKHIIRDATNQKPDADDEEGLSYEHDGRKLLNYDLEILNSFVKSRGSQSVVVAIQDSEAFDTGLITDLVSLFSSWLDRIPFILLFGIATSVDLFHERLSRAASRCLYGRQFDVEQASTLLERIFEKAIASSDAPLRLSSGIVSTLMDRQHNHLQSVQSFITSLKYSYMCHFYDDPLSILSVSPEELDSVSKVIRKEHLQSVRMLPSFRKHVESLVEARDLTLARGLLEDDSVLLEEIKSTIFSRKLVVDRLLRAMHLAAISSPEPVGKIDLYITSFQGGLGDSDLIQRTLDSIKRMAPEDLLSFLQKLKKPMEEGVPSLNLSPWASEAPELYTSLNSIASQVTTLQTTSLASKTPIRSSYTIHTSNLRTTIIAQRVQLSYEKSSLSPLDIQYTSLINTLSSTLLQTFTFPSPHSLFLSETHIYSHLSPHRLTFTPRPRYSIELALSSPYEYLACTCCEAIEGLSSTHPTTAILYQMYLETGGLINIYDLWEAFKEMINGGEKEMGERDVLVLFYRGLADLKSLGLVKLSKKKADHLGKGMWKGL